MNRTILKFALPALLVGALSGVVIPRPCARAAAQDRAGEKAAKDGGQSTASDERGSRKIWEDRGDLSPKKVYFGAASLASDPLSRLPSPPFSHFEPDDKDKMATSPKAKLKDSRGVKWTAKFGEEVHADTVAPRLAWALGYGAVDGYYVAPGKIQGIDASTDLGREKGAIQPDGSFPGGARFKRHSADDEPIKDASGVDLTWDEGHNPGVPPEQLSGLLIFDVMVNNWDAQPKNCKVYRVAGANGPETWYIASDLGASFADGPRHKFILARYQKEDAFIRRVAGDTVDLNFSDAIPAQAHIHQHVPLAHAQWFRKQLTRLTDDEIQAAFDASFATDALNAAYATGDPAKIKEAREHELSAGTRAEIAGFAAKFRAKIDEFTHKIPAG